MISSRERVNNAVLRKPNDRAPYNFRAEPIVYAKIKRAMALASDEAVRQWACSDVRDVGVVFDGGGYGGYSGFGWRDKEVGPGVQEDFWGVRRERVCNEGGEFVEIRRHPLKDASFDEIRKCHWPDPRGMFDFTPLPRMIAQANGEGQYWWMIEGESMFDRSWALRGTEQLLMDLLDQPALADFLLEKMAGFFFEYTRMILEKAGGMIDAIGIYNDLGTQNGMLLSPLVYREFIKPRQKRYVEMVKTYGAKVFYHSCGAVEPILPDLAEIGVDIIDPLQMRAMRVTPEGMKKKHGTSLTLHGGLDTQGFLQAASAAEAAAEARHLLNTLGAGGGYILSGSHLYQADVPLENIAAIHGAATEERL